MILAVRIQGESEDPAVIFRGHATDWAMSNRGPRKNNVVG
jgi:hypothetical protein